MADNSCISDGRPIPPAGLVREQYTSTELSVTEGVAGTGVQDAPPAAPSRIKNAIVWFAAAIGALGMYVGIQIVVPLISGLLLAIPALTVGLGGLVLMHLVASVVLVVTELITVAVFFAWWRHLRPRAVLLRGERAPGARTVALRLLAIFLLGIGTQLAISLMLTLLLPLFPVWDAEYSELMSDPLFSELSAVSLLVVAITAPLIEESMCRGVVMEFVTRGLCPEQHMRWRKRRRASVVLSDIAADVTPTFVSSRMFWCANIIQALLFAILHLNVVQGTYAFLIGLLLGWIAHRTGKLSYSMCLHFVINFSSYFVGQMMDTLSLLGEFGVLVVPWVLVACGAVLFERLSGPSTGPVL